MQVALADARASDTKRKDKRPMQIRPRLEAVIEDMLDGHIMLDEALEEFEKLYIQKAYTRNKKRITHTATALGIHRNTISKRVNSYRAQERKSSRSSANHHNPRKNH
ncbi:MAG TPA: hypothetical protein DC054_18860 [Blastocatellia bacterium]|nr:hypothetical protein [Blastocatellia bacterium]